MQTPLSSTLVAGASNQIGHFLLPRLAAAGHTVLALSRQPPAGTALANVTWQRCDLRLDTPNIRQPSILIFAAPLPLLVPLLQRLGSEQIRRVIAFSSTSRFTKAASDNPHERAIAEQLAQAETALIDYCEQQHIAWTLFRPTLIYGCGQDKNISFIIRFIQRFGFFPLLGEGRGLRQPVHADDLAQACLAAYDNPRTFARAYQLSGGETLSYRTLLNTIFQRLQRKPRLLTLPAGLFALTIRILNRLPPFAHLTPAMAYRMNQDLCFDHHAATADFHYQPRAFSHADLGCSP